MSIFKCTATAALLLTAAAASAEGPGLGQPLEAADIPFYATYITPEGAGLPAGSGTAAQGAEVYAAKCATCHGATGSEGPVMPPVGPNDIWAKAAGSYWPYATTLFDYIRRAMPLEAPKSLSDDEVYALAAYILERNGVIDEQTAMTAETLPAVKMPNHGNFLDVWAKQGAQPW